MSEIYVLDSFAILSLLGSEAGSVEVSRLLNQAQEGEVNLLMTWVNVGEVAYIVERRYGRDRLHQTLATLEATNIQILPVGRELALIAAHIKSEYPIAYADAFTAALVTNYEATLVTGDPEFKVLEETLSIHWLPPVA